MICYALSPFTCIYVSHIIYATNYVDQNHLYHTNCADSVTLTDLWIWCGNLKNITDLIAFEEWWSFNLMDLSFIGYGPSFTTIALVNSFDFFSVSEG